MKILSLLFFGLIIIYSSATPAHAFADSGCFPLNNGGVTTRQFCPTSTQQPAFPSQNSMKQTTPSQKVFPASKAKSTPNTGPEVASLIGLFPLAAAGLFLKKKTK